ncbi:halocyanin-like protein [Halohasta litchfieldiae]|jgi:halocyanin-like protein|uniref:Halocyanin domain-containing protein n=1 Tax=Halohasta litchfieldiae TaxID=1073996 RepID=A0A1H6XUP3_9EURY|nr:halocyanin domain-containing protein [Halohasta litchfieldiae]ATW86859.1 halocyanin-like protein [Halohasta litchfieldiae]SEJ31896.1 halocyanin domain-containing protein [Halohasta litchfieldiae]
MTASGLLRRRRFARYAGTALTISLTGCTGGEDESLPESDDTASTAEGLVDRTGQDRVTVEVGAGADGVQFAPAEIRISVGTTVIWEWTGRGGGHNVVEAEGTFVSHEDRGTTDEAGYTFEHMFDETGSYEYVCQPHAKQGMSGSVDVIA